MVGNLECSSLSCNVLFNSLYAKAVDIWNFGNIKRKYKLFKKLIFCGNNFSPNPFASWNPPLIKNGTSAPNDNPISSNFLVEKFKFHNLFNVFKVVAALLLPPPNPAPIGIFFFNCN